jgi:N-acetylmuramoyl-L-alanine amidase
MKTSLIASVLVLIATPIFAAPTRGNVEVVAATLILEAGGERDPRAMEAVMEVIRNRAVARNRSMESICLQRLQFSCWNSISVQNGIAKAKKHPKWKLALTIVNSSPTYHTSGADHYHTHAVNPSWNRKMNRTVVIQNHVFFRS